MSQDKKEYQIKGSPLIKFQSKERIDAFRKGTVYMKSLEYYRKREEETGENTVGDRFEAMAHANDGWIIVPGLGIHEKLSDALLKTSFSNSYVFCMLELPSGVELFEFDSMQKEKIAEFGDTALLITDRSEFLKRVQQAITQEGLKGYHGTVKYYNESSDCAEYWFSLIRNGMQGAAFWKRQIYAYQQEYRLLIEQPPTENDYYILDIGSIKDISVVLETDKALNAIAQSISY